jgi:hypothetical protein
MARQAYSAGVLLARVNRHGMAVAPAAASLAVCGMKEAGWLVRIGPVASGKVQGTACTAAGRQSAGAGTGAVDAAEVVPAGALDVTGRWAPVNEKNASKPTRAAVASTSNQPLELPVCVR